MINYLLLAGIAIGLGFLIGKGTHFLKITGVVGYIITGIIIGFLFRTLAEKMNYFLHFSLILQNP